MQYLPTAVMLLSTLGWAFGNVGNKAALAYFEPFLLIALRFAASAVTLWLVIVLSGRAARLRQVRPAQVMLGLVEPFTVGALLVLGVSLTSASHVVLLWALMPVTSTILGQLVMKERPSGAVVWGAALAIAGSVVLVLGGPMTAGSLLGDALVVVGVLIASLNQILVRRIAMSGADPVVTSTSQVSMSAVCAWLAVMIATPSDLSGLAAPAEGWLLVTTLGVFGSALPFIAYNYALRTMPMGRSALFMPMIAPLGAALAAVWLGEPLSLNVIVALLLTLTGVLLPNIAGLLPKRQPAQPRPEA
jgi:drug/metabolite transporter (DMT)-like permease